MLKVAIMAAAGSAMAGMALVGVGATEVAAIPGMLVTGGATSPDAARQVPPGMLAIYRAAAPSCPGLSWAVLAAVGTVESANGTSDSPGVRSGANPAGAEGPMQFEPGTFARYADPVPPGGARPPNPYDPVDAVYAAARYLCSLGIANDPRDALVAYNCGNAGPRCGAVSAGYAAEVLRLATGFVAVPTAVGPSEALAFAESQIGVPYVWGGEDPGQAFDCSGLTQWAYAQVGVALPRTAQEQFDGGPPVEAGSPLQPGDLVFFGTGPAAVEHVGLYAGDGEMIDAPHTGADVRLDEFPTQIGAFWGSEQYLGATQPVGPPTVRGGG